MKGKKIIFLFLALLLPGCIFLFLKIFGKNEFAVEPLFQTEAPALPAHCSKTSAPYVVPVSMMKGLIQETDSLALVHIGPMNKWRADAEKTYKRLFDFYFEGPVTVVKLEVNDADNTIYDCDFAMKKPLDIVLVDRKGTIRGQYNSTDRDELDRLMTEVTIILKQY